MGALWVIAFISLGFAESSWIVHSQYSNTKCEGLPTSVTIWADSVCIDGGSNHRSSLSCSKRNVISSECFAENCTACKQRTSLPYCASLSRITSESHECVEELPSFPGYIQHGIFSSSICDLDELQQYSYYDHTGFCNYIGGKYVLFQCNQENNVIAATCSDSMCTSDCQHIQYPRAICAPSNKTDTFVTLRCSHDVLTKRAKRQTIAGVAIGATNAAGDLGIGVAMTGISALSTTLVDLAAAVLGSSVLGDASTGTSGSGGAPGSAQL